MTNSEYEAASITAAGYADKFEGEHKLKQCDKAIAVLEESLARLQAERREIVNRYDLNKLEFTSVCPLPCVGAGNHALDDTGHCRDCGKTMEQILK